MGVASSSQKSSEGDHFVQIINPSKAKALKDLDGATGVVISSRARALKSISFDALWENFLNSSTTSFALTQSEITSLLTESIATVDISDGTKIDAAAVALDIKTYVSLVEELSEKDTAKTIDFMAVCSSVLLLSGKLIISNAFVSYFNSYHTVILLTTMTPRNH